MKVNPYTYIKYTLPSGVEVLLTSRPDSYEESDVNDFIEEYNPIVRFQLTDDRLKREIAEDIPVHWYTWFPGRRLPPELVYPCVSLLNYYIESGDGNIWMHCDSSTMRAPTMFGAYLMCYHDSEKENIIENSEYTCDYRRKSCPLKYAETSMQLDPGVEELITNWKEGGEDQAHNYLANLRN